MLGSFAASVKSDRCSGPFLVKVRCRLENFCAGLPGRKTNPLEALVNIVSSSHSRFLNKSARVSKPGRPGGVLEWHSRVVVSPLLPHQTV